jgi:hypothetical protein
LHISFFTYVGLVSYGPATASSNFGYHLLCHFFGGGYRVIYNDSGSRMCKFFSTPGPMPLLAPVTIAI